MSIPRNLFDFYKIYKKSIEMLKLNNSQEMAVNTLNGAVLILAGAGTGKTATLTARIANLIYTKTAHPSEILAVTFTNKAAREMKQRVENIAKNSNFSEDISKMWIGTFHGISARILRMYAKSIDLDPSFIIIDTGERKKIIKQVIQELELDEKRFSVNNIGFIISTLKENGIKSNNEEKISEFSQKDLNIIEIYQYYQNKLKGLNAVDFDDLILESVNLLANNAQILNDLHERFKYILVDEYQDTNKIQHLWLSILASKYGNICCVGDEDQSIYGWRGAKIEFILNFPKDFPNAKIIKLEENYRSTIQILNAATSLISKNIERYDKILISPRNGNQPNIVILEDDRKESNHIAKKIYELKNQFEFKQMAILVRATYQMRIIEESLVGNKIPYNVVDGMKFYDRKEIKDLIAYLRLSYSDLDLLAFDRVANAPKRGLGEKTVQNIVEYAQKNSCGIVKSLKNLLYSGNFSQKVSIEVQILTEKLEKWQNFISENKNDNKNNISDIVEMIYNESGYASMLKEQLEEAPDESNRIENVREFLSSLKHFYDVGDFLEHVSLLSSADINDDTNKVQILTMHGAKGLEFDVVFLPGWDEEMFPSKRSIEESGNKGIEEERRLAYVAMTRAKNEIFIYTCRQRMTFGRIQLCIPSRFIKELGEHKNVINGLNVNEYQSFNQQINGNNILSQLRTNNQNKNCMRLNNGLQKSNNILILGSKVSHKLFGNGEVTNIIGHFFEISFKNGDVKVVKGDFLTLIK